MADEENGIARGDVLAYLLAKDEKQPQDEPLIAANKILHFTRQLKKLLKKIGTICNVM